MELLTVLPEPQLAIAAASGQNSAVFGEAGTHDLRGRTQGSLKLGESEANMRSLDLVSFIMENHRKTIGKWDLPSGFIKHGWLENP